MSQSSLTMEECHRKRGEQLCVWFPFFESIQSLGPGPDYCLVKRLMRSLHIFLTGDLARRTRLNVFAWCQLGILGTSWQSGNREGRETSRTQLRRCKTLFTLAVKQGAVLVFPQTCLLSLGICKGSIPGTSVDSDYHMNQKQLKD